MTNLTKFGRRLACAGALLLAAIALSPAQAAAPLPPTGEPTAEQIAAIQAQQEQAAADLLKVLKRETGTVSIAAADAELTLGDQYYFVGPEQSRTILVDVWRNPPGAADGVLGMVFPKGKDFIDDTWSAVVTFESTGYVSDEDAKTADYNAMIEEMRSASIVQASATRAQGYPAGILQGWAQPPTYDARQHSLVWARDIKFDDTPNNTLNYDIRLLGRSGVLSLNILAGMDQLAEVREAAKTFATVASFKTGARYADYNPSTDKKAEYGVAGLVAAGAGVAVAKKVGLLAVLAKFGKFLIIGLIALLALFRNSIAGLFGRKQAIDADEWPDAATEPADDAGADPPAAPDRV